MPSKQDPTYTVAVVKPSGDKYDLTGVLTRVRLAEKAGQIAQSLNLRLVNIKSGDTYLNSLIELRDRVFVYADDGERSGEVFRGFVWIIAYSSKSEKELSLTCYDNLIYFQESEDNPYFTAGRSTEDICTSICSDWGVKLEYTYGSITHGKMPLKGTLSDIFLSDVLDEAKKQLGERYVMRSTADVVQIAPVGSNETVYHLKRQENVISTSSEQTMEGMITKVVITGSEGEDERAEVEAVVSGDTELYGTLQKLQSKDGDTELADAKKEADETIKDKGSPKTTYDLEASDVPWIRKGDIVKVTAGNMTESYIVSSVEHDVTASEKTMALTMEEV